MSDSEKSGEKIPFEAAYIELTSIIDELESGELSLDDSMKRFERGKTLLTLCERMLNTAELRVNQLSQDTEGKG